VQNLDLQGTRLTIIAARAGMTKQSMLELVDKAEALGFVERRADPDDRRAKVVAFTPMGLALLELVREGVAAAEQRMAAVMGIAFVDEMRQLLNASLTAPGDDALRMADGNAAWRTRSISRVLLSTSRAFVRDVEGVHAGGFTAVARST